MDNKNFEKKLELREWQKMFNPSKPSTDDSVILKKTKNQSKEKNTNNSCFSWG